MSNTPNQHEKPGANCEASLANVLDRILADSTLGKDRRADVASAIRTLSKKVIRRHPTQINASPQSLRAKLAETTAAMVGLSENRLRNVVSLTRFALHHTGIADWPAPHLRTHTVQWRDLLALVQSNQKRFWLSKFSGYCSAKGIAPEQVRDAYVDQFYQDLDAASLKRKPETVHRKVCQFWNECAATIVGWPQTTLAVPDRRKSYVLPWAAFPPSFAADVEDYLAYLAGRDVLEFRNFRTLRASSIKTNRELIRQFASALVHRGHDAGEIRQLRDLLPLDTLRKGLRYYTLRENNGGNRQAYRFLILLNTMAKRWAHIEPAHADQLRQLLDNINLSGGTRRPGLTEKNKARLRQFDSGDSEAVSALLNAPQRIMSKLPLDRAPTHDEALAAQTALAIEIFVMVPIRINNAVGLDLDRHVIRGRDGSACLAIVGEEVKNGFDIEAPLPDSTAKLLDVYLTQFRPKLKNANTAWLFPGRGPIAPKTVQQLRKQIQETFARNFGLKVNPHLFRHIAAMFFLRANPGQYGVVQLLLGHKSIETTMAFYCGLEGSAAVRQYDEHVLLRRSRLNSGTCPA